MKKFVVSVIAILLTNNREAKYGEVVDEALLNNASKLEKEGFIKTEEDFNADKKVSEKSIKANREAKDKALVPAVDSVKSQNAIVDAEKNIDAVKQAENTTVQTGSTVSEADAKPAPAVDSKSAAKKELEAKMLAKK